MAGRFTIQKYPTGLPGLLSMKASGDTPPDLASQISAGIDITEFYLALEFRVAQGSTNGVGTSGFFPVTAPASGLVVPEGEMWCVRRSNALITSGLPAGTSYTFRSALLRRGFAAVTQIQLSEAQGKGTVGELPGVSQVYTPWVLAFPGDAFGVWVESLALGVATPFAVNVEYSRIPI